MITIDNGKTFFIEKKKQPVQDAALPYFSLHNNSHTLEL